MIFAAQSHNTNCVSLQVAPRLALIMAIEDQPSQPKPFGIWLKGAFISNLCGFVCLAILWVVGSKFDWRLLGDFGSWTSGTLVASTFLVVPFGIGFFASLFWKPANLSSGARFGWTFFNFLFSLVGAMFVLREGSICLVMASPLLLGLMWIGSATGALFWARNSFLGASVLPLLIGFLVFDAAQPHSYHETVVTEFHSTQSPQKLWRYVANYPRNDAPPTWWMNRLGLPYPLKSKGEAKIGGRRDVEFSGKVFAGERITRVQPNRLIEFEIDRQPAHPEITNHFKMKRGQIELLPDGKGGTLLRATGDYELRVFPAWYFGYWTNATLHNLHFRVFEHMNRLANAN